MQILFALFYFVPCKSALQEKTQTLVFGIGTTLSNEVAEVGNVLLLVYCIEGILNGRFELFIGQGDHGKMSFLFSCGVVL